MPRSERSRWVTVFTLDRPGTGTNADMMINRHDRALAVVQAFAKVGRVVRIEEGQWNGQFVLKARKA